MEEQWIPDQQLVIQRLLCNKLVVESLLFAPLGQAVRVPELSVSFLFSQYYVRSAWLQTWRDNVHMSQLK
jgi:hypothetical protein